MPTLPTPHENSDPWPSHKITANTPTSHPRHQPKYAILLATGSFNPIHHGHLTMMERARSCLEAEGFTVLGGFLSPCHDAYLQFKSAGRGGGYLHAEDRIKYVQSACADSSWLACSSWEVQQVSLSDFVQVLLAMYHRFSQPGALPHHTALTCFYVCGADVYTKCGLHEGMWHPHLGVVVVPRASTCHLPAPANARVFRAAPAHPYASLSATEIRRLITQGEPIGHHVHAGVGEMLLAGIHTCIGHLCLFPKCDEKETRKHA